MEPTDFSWALRHLQAGETLSRSGWNAPGQWIKLQFPDHVSKMTRPYIYIKTAHSDLVPWLASQTDLLMDDWYIV